MRIYHVPGSRSTRVVWLLEELGAPYEVTVLPADRAERQAIGHGERHPLGRVPVLEEDGGLVFESAAICLHLADRHPDLGLIPPVGTHERALVYQWTLFSMTELEARLMEWFGSNEQSPELAATAAERLVTAAEAVAAALDGREYLVGDRLTVADVVCGGVLGSVRRRNVVELPQRLNDYLDALEARPAKRRANEVGA